MSHQIDSTDKIILTELLADARTPYLDIARKCGISGAAVHQRMHKLEDAGIISGTRLLVKPSAVGFNVCVFINISLSEADKYKDVVENLKQVPEIVECHFVTGKYALIVKAYCVNNDELINVLIRKIVNIPYVQSTETMIALDTAFERQVWIKDLQK